MSSAKLPNDGLLEQAARQISDRILSIAPELHNQRLAITDTLPVWFLKKNRADAASFSLSPVALHRWHHQITANDNPVAFARSSLSTNDRSQLLVAEIVVGHIPRMVDDAVRWLHVPMTADCRLITIPSLYVHAFWSIEHENPAGRIVVADAPSELKSLKKRTVFTFNEFVENVKVEMPPAVPVEAPPRTPIETPVLQETSLRLDVPKKPKLSEFGSLRSYFSGIGFKRLSATDVDFETSHGQEIQGVVALQKVLGTGPDKVDYHAVSVYFNDQNKIDPPAQEGAVTWYDTRRNKSGRNPEYRLYYKSHSRLIYEYTKTGDSLMFAVAASGVAYLFMAQHNSEAERQLFWLFGLSQHIQELVPGDLEKLAGTVLRLARIKP